MIEFLNVYLPIILMILAIILLVVLIILGVKAIKTLTKVNTLVDDVNEKMDSLRGIFDMVEKLSCGVETVGFKVIDALGNLTAKLFKGKNKEEDDE